MCGRYVKSNACIQGIMKLWVSFLTALRIICLKKEKKRPKEISSSPDETFPPVLKCLGFFFPEMNWSISFTLGHSSLAAACASCPPSAPSSTLPGAIHILSRLLVHENGKTAFILKSLVVTDSSGKSLPICIAFTCP